jgi:hypothetical protein
LAQTCFPRPAVLLADRIQGPRTYKTGLRYQLVKFSRWANEMNPHSVLISVRDAWAVLGPLVGVLIGGYITTRTQKKQWVRDNKRTEYRELLTTIADAGGKFVVFYGMVPVVATPSEQFSIGETARTSVDVIYNRLFVAKEIEELGIQRRWENAISELKKSHNVDAFGRSMDSMMEDIRRKALKEFS